MLTRCLGPAPAGKKKSHGWCDFAPGSAVSDTRQGYAINDTLIVSADILVLNESVSFTREADIANSANGTLVSVRTMLYTLAAHLADCS